MKPRAPGSELIDSLRDLIHGWTQRVQRVPQPSPSPQTSGEYRDILERCIRIPEPVIADREETDPAAHREIVIMNDHVVGRRKECRRDASNFAWSD